MLLKWQTLLWIQSAGNLCFLQPQGVCLPCLWVTPNSILQALQELLPWAGAVCSWEGGVQDLAGSAELEPVLCFHEIIAEKN